MIVLCGVPAEDVVATATIGAEAALMSVVTGMAGMTVAVAEIAEIRAAVASVAGDAFVFAHQPETRNRKVIECGVFPRRCAVTICTLGTVPALVNII